MNTAIDANDLLIRTLPTPNPFALKFVINASFKDIGKATYNAPIECAEYPLVRDLFSVDGVRQVHLFQNTLTVTHSGDLENDDLSEKISAVIRSRFSVHDPKLGENTAPTAKQVTQHADPVLQQVEEILNRTIRPGLQADGGDIEVLGLENDELRIVYQGACGGCPSSMMGTLDAIQGILRNELGNEKLVVLPV